jgi:hypothetical protein
MKVSINTVIDAIENEPDLMTGQFVDRADSRLASTPCSVCAVGAVLRAVVPETATLLDVDAMAVINCTTIITGDPMHHIARGDWLSALSVFFEQAAPETRREDTIEFVRKHFPDTIEVELPQSLVPR